MKLMIVPVPTEQTIPTLDEIRARMRREMLADGFAHVLRVVELARELAVIHGVDPDRAEAAALMHDIADRCSEKDLLQRADKYGIELNLTEARVPKLIHGKVGAEILRQRVGHQRRRNPGRGSIPPVGLHHDGPAGEGGVRG